ncbi:hypothetical protein Tco_0203445 [Tanacetum coccineum]
MAMLEGGRGTRNTRVVRTVRDLNAIPPKVIRCYNYKGEGNYAKQCTSKKRVKDSEWFKEKMLLAQQQEAWIEISDEQQDSHVGSVNKDEVGLTYDSYILSEVIMKTKLFKR